jgi:hypothetical protein
MNKRSRRRRQRAGPLIRRSVVVGVAWYSEDQWALVKASATDPERFEASYPEWVTMAEEALQQLQAAGVAPIKVLVHSAELSAWCLAHGKRNEAGARAQLASEKL